MINYRDLPWMEWHRPSSPISTKPKKGPQVFALLRAAHSLRDLVTLHWCGSARTGRSKTTSTALRCRSPWRLEVMLLSADHLGLSSSSWGYPFIAGWFLSGKITSRNGCWLGVPPVVETPTWTIQWNQLAKIRIVKNLAEIAENQYLITRFILSLLLSLLLLSSSFFVPIYVSESDNPVYPNTFSRVYRENHD